jgi:hypothetical protein
MLEQVTYGGTGCPQGSVGSIISEDGTTMTLIFDSYVASMGSGISITESRKNCQLNIDLLYPAGFQYSVFSADYRGYVALDKGVTGTQKSIYYFSGQTAQVCCLTEEIRYPKLTVLASHQLPPPSLAQSPRTT